MALFKHIRQRMQAKREMKEEGVRERVEGGEREGERDEIEFQLKLQTVCGNLLTESFIMQATSDAVACSMCACATCYTWLGVAAN